MIYVYPPDGLRYRCDMPTYHPVADPMRTCRYCIRDRSWENAQWRDDTRRAADLNRAYNALIELGELDLAGQVRAVIRRRLSYVTPVAMKKTARSNSGSQSPKSESRG